MEIVLVNIVPLAVIFFLGVILRLCGVFAQSVAYFLLKLFFYLALPALIMLSIPGLQLNADLMFLPLSSMLIIFCTALIAFMCSRVWPLNDQTFAVFLIGAMIMNGGFVFPFVLASYGQEGIALAALFDFGTALIVFTFVYFQACRYGRDGRNGILHLLRKFLVSPPLLALCLAFTLNVTGIKITPIVTAVLLPLANLATPVVLLALGLAFDHHVVRRIPLITVLFIRMGFGLLIGYGCCQLFQLQGLPRTVTLIMAAAPSGMNTLVFSSMEELETPFAASIVSYSTLLGMFWVPLLIYLFSY